MGFAGHVNSSLKSNANLRKPPKRVLYFNQDLNYKKREKETVEVVHAIPKQTQVAMRQHIEQRIAREQKGNWIKFVFVVLAIIGCYVAYVGG